MRRLACTGLLAMAVGIFTLPLGSAQEKKAAGGISVTYFGQSFFILTTPKGKKIAFDPHTIPDYERVDPKDIHADVITISHNHNDHTGKQAIGNFKDAKVLTGLKGPSLKANWNTVNEDFDGIKIRSVGVYHDDQEGLMRGKNGVFIVEVDGWRIAHLGDLGHLLTPAQLKRIGPVDVLMIPVGGIYTLNGSEAKKVVDQIKPKEYIFPMHYGTKVFDAVLTADEFLETFEKRAVVISDENFVKLNKDATRPRPLVVQLNYWPKEEAKKDEKKKEK
jgi:L-ascorbate metabolism protein UlaG (beta-lactamase superfamily)